MKWLFTMVLLASLPVASCDGPKDKSAPPQTDNYGDKYRKITLEIPDRIEIVYVDASETGHNLCVVRVMDDPAEIAELIDEINKTPCRPTGELLRIFGHLSVIKDGEQIAAIVVSTSAVYSIDKDGKFSPQSFQEGSPMWKIQQEILRFHEKRGVERAQEQATKWNEWRDGVIAAAKSASTFDMPYESHEEITEPDAPHGWKALSPIKGVRINYGCSGRVIVYPAEWKCKYIGTKIIDSLMPMALFACSENCQIFIPGHKSQKQDDYILRFVEALGARQVEHEEGRPMTEEDIKKLFSDQPAADE